MIGPLGYDWAAWNVVLGDTLLGVTAAVLFWTSVIMVWRYWGNGRHNHHSG